MVRPHDEILLNLLTLKTGYVEIASRLGFGINLVFYVITGHANNVFHFKFVSSKSLFCLHINL
jgi:hypothetical protein